MSDTTPRLFQPITLRSLTIKNRIWLSPMCQYSVDARDGVPHAWHAAHLGARAIGGFGLIVTEATAVVPEGRITPQDTGIWNDDQVASWRGITDFAHTQGAAIAVQLAHAGRKASTYRPWSAEHGTVPAAQGGWRAVAPSAVAFPTYDEPRALTTDEVAQLPAQFAAGAERAVRAGFDAVELHAAHGYLLHEFLSPLSNRRTDRYGGDLRRRAAVVIDTVRAVRDAIGDRPLLVRVSATDWLDADGGLTVSDSELVAEWLRDAGADLIDVSTGGNLPAPIPVGPGYQVFAARQVRRAGLPVGAVGMINDPLQAEQILADDAADVVFLARAAIDDPNWPLHAADLLLRQRAAQLWPPQMVRGRRWYLAR